MPNLVDITPATTEINRGQNPPPPQALSVSNHPGQIGLSELLGEYKPNLDRRVDRSKVKFHLYHTLVKYLRVGC